MRKVRRDPLDDLYTRYLRLREDNRCEYCHKKAYVETCHFHGRRKWITRHDDDNILGACRGCHGYFHDHPNIHAEFMKLKLGSERYEALNNRAQIVMKRIQTEYDGRMNDLKEKIKLLEGE